MEAVCKFQKMYFLTRSFLEMIKTGSDKLTEKFVSGLSEYSASEENDFRFKRNIRRTITRIKHSRIIVMNRSL